MSQSGSRPLTAEDQNHGNRDKRGRERLNRRQGSCLALFTTGLDVKERKVFGSVERRGKTIKKKTGEVVRCNQKAKGVGGDKDGIS